MVEVTKYNFDDEFPQIIERIESAAFIAIDTEFTALTIDYQKEKSRYENVLSMCYWFIPSTY